jgi:putative transposase
LGGIVLQVNPKFTSQQCSHCGHIDSESRDKERFVCTNCGYIADADNQAAVNIGMIGLEILGISPSKLLGVTQEVTGTSEATDAVSNNREKSRANALEPTNPIPPTPRTSAGRGG